MAHTLKTIRSVAASCRYMSTKSLVNITVDSEGIATLQMQRAPVNALNLDLIQELRDSIIDVEKNKCKALVLTSANLNIFSAGMDLKEFVNPDVKRITLVKNSLIDTVAKLFGTDMITTVAINVMLNQRSGIIHHHSMTLTVILIHLLQIVGRGLPIQARIIHGYTGAGACVLALACEYRTMTAGKARIGLNDTAVGTAPAKWIIDLMTRAMGSKHAEYALTSSYMFPADKALQVGLIDEIATDKTDAVERCKAFIKMYDHVSPAARAATKRSMRHEYLTELEKNRNKYVTDFIDTLSSASFQDTINKYVQSMKQSQK